jgi:hypothetical protein
MRLSSCVFAFAFAFAATGCDYHQTSRPRSARVAEAGGVRASLVSVGYDHTTLAVTIEVVNDGPGAVLFVPKDARLVLARGRDVERTVAPLTEAMDPGGNIVDRPLVTGINEAVRGPYSGRATAIARGDRRRFTLQYSLQIADDVVISADTMPARIPLRDGCVLDLHSAFVTESGAHVDADAPPLAVEIVDVHEPDLGFAPPQPAHAMFIGRFGGGPGFGPTEGVAGLELGAGPRWGKAAMTFSATLGFGFPLALEGSYRWLETSAVHSALGFGPVVWFFPGGPEMPGGPRFGPRASIDIVYDAGPHVLGYPTRNVGMGLYTRGGPILYPARVGGELEIGIELGMF